MCCTTVLIEVSVVSKSCPKQNSRASLEKSKFSMCRTTEVAALAASWLCMVGFPALP